MKVKIQDLKDSQKLIKIEVEAERVEAVLEEVYRDIQKKANIAGFRVGKAPRDLVKLHYEKTANNEALSRLVQESYRQAVEENNIRLLNYPVIEDISFSNGKPLQFSARADVRPEFKLKNYKGIRLKIQTPEVTEEEIDKALKDIQVSLAQYKDMGDKNIELGDYVVCEYRCFVDGKLVDKNDKLWLYITEQFQPKGLLEALIGSTKGVIKEVEIDHPNDYQNKNLAGKKAFYKVTPREIKQRILPEVNDDLAKETGRFKDLKELKEHIRGYILNTKQQQNQRNLEEQIFDFLLKNHSFDVPFSVVERQTARLVEDAKLRLLYQGYRREDVEKQQAQLEKTLSDNAKNNVRLFFILEEIAQQEKIAASEEELKDSINLIAQSNKEDPAEVRERLESNHLIENLREQIAQDKVVKFLLNEANKE